MQPDPLEMHNQHSRQPVRALSTSDCTRGSKAQGSGHRCVAKSLQQRGEQDSAKHQGPTSLKHKCGHKYRESSLLQPPGRHFAMVQFHTSEAPPSSHSSDESISSSEEACVKERPADDATEQTLGNDYAL